MAGVRVPLHAAEHYYLITEPIDGMHSDMPVVEDPDLFAYYREESGGLMLGLFEPVAQPWGMNGIPDGFSFGEIAPDWDRMAPHLERAMERIPMAREAGIKMLFCGPESFTPDMGPMMGAAPELEHYFVAAGFNSLGILLGGGVGRIMAQWIVDGHAPVPKRHHHSEDDGQQSDYGIDQNAGDRHAAALQDRFPHAIQHPHPDQQEKPATTGVVPARRTKLHPIGITVSPRQLAIELLHRTVPSFRLNGDIAMKTP